ncbi:MAG TPA: CBS domain-containing protein [Gillisia sp.]|nr:CBS domain-containing protein [Gillisia sp.]
MSIENYIVNDIGICRLSDTIGNLKIIFNEQTFTHLPVENDGVYLGCISKNDVSSFDEKKTIADFQYVLEGFFAREDNYWLDTLDIFAQNQTNILPVLNSENKYLGYITLSSILNLFYSTPFLNEPGGIIVIEKGYRDYSFSEISQIAESHNAGILGMFISSRANDLAQITIKLSTSSLNEILQTYRRYGYTIISEHQEDNFNKKLKDRSEYLDKYLNI